MSLTIFSTDLIGIVVGATTQSYGIPLVISGFLSAIAYLIRGSGFVDSVFSSPHSVLAYVLVQFTSCFAFTVVSSTIFGYFMSQWPPVSYVKMAKAYSISFYTLIIWVGAAVAILTYELLGIWWGWIGATVAMIAFVIVFLIFTYTYVNKRGKAGSEYESFADVRDVLTFTIWLSVAIVFRHAFQLFVLASFIPTYKQEWTSVISFGAYILVLIAAAIVFKCMGASSQKKVQRMVQNALTRIDEEEDPVGQE
jgi:MFS family permease